MIDAKEFEYRVQRERADAMADFGRALPEIPSNVDRMEIHFFYDDGTSLVALVSDISPMPRWHRVRVHLLRAWKALIFKPYMGRR